MSISVRLAKLEQRLKPSAPDEALKARLNRAFARMGLPAIEGPVYRSNLDPAERLKRAEARLRKMEEEVRR